jgi:hypothetical protein
MARDPASRLLDEALLADPARVDALYGLEPVYEPGSDPRQRPLDASCVVHCPACWQAWELSVDLTLGRRQSWLEDCPHCCHPARIDVEVDDEGSGATAVASSDG